MDRTGFCCWVDVGALLCYLIVAGLLQQLLRAGGPLHVSGQNWLLLLG